MQSLPRLDGFKKKRKTWNCHQHRATFTRHFFLFYKWRSTKFKRKYSFYQQYIYCVCTVALCNNTLFRLDDCKLWLMRRMQRNLKIYYAQPYYVILFIVRGNVTVILPFQDPRDRSYCKCKIALQLSIFIVSQ